MMDSANARLAAEAVRHRLMLLRYSNSQAATLIKLLRQGNPQVIAHLLKGTDGLDVSNMTTTRLRAIARDLLVEVKKVYADIWARMDTDLDAFGQHEVKYQQGVLQKAIPAEIVEVSGKGVELASWQQVAATTFKKPMMGLSIVEWFTKKLPADLTNALVNGVRNGIQQGQSTLKVINELRKSAVWGTHERNLATAVHSAISHVAADARDMTADANADLIKSRQWLSTLDNHTSPMCIIRDHVLYTMAQPVEPLLKGDPPYGAGPGRLHYRCRSVEVWVLKSWSEMGLPESKLSTRTRASMDGQVPASMNYREWLEKRASIATQDQVLGVIRAELLRAGKFKVGDFYDDGKLIPLDKLIELDYSAM